MTVESGYHCVVKFSGQRSISASFLLFGVLLVSALVSTGSAQNNSGHSSGSVSFSSAMGGHSFNGAPPTALTVAPPTATHVAPPTAATGHIGSGAHFGGFAGGVRNGDGHHHPHRGGNGSYYPYAYPYYYGVPIPYAADVNQEDDTEGDNDPEYQGGPTIFDRRGSGAASYVPPTYEGPAHAVGSLAAQSADEPVSESPQAPTTLVFKDGHQLVVDNYAIVAQTLYDLTPGHSRKIVIGDLDLPATEKQNEDHGVIFQLPPSAQGS